LRKVGVGWIVGPHEAGSVFIGDVCNRDAMGRCLSGDETAPGFVALVNDLGCVLPVLGLAGEGKSVFGLSVGNFVDPEPLIGCPDETGKVPLDILDVVEFGRKWVTNVHDNDLPVRLAFVEEGHDTENLHLLDLANEANVLADLAYIEGIIVASCLGLGVRRVRVFPRLGECTVVPNVAVVREAVANETKLFLLDVLLDGVEWFLLADFHLGVGPTGDLDDHVEDSAVLVGE